MARRKIQSTEPLMDFMTRSHEHFLKTHRFIKERWSVVEVTPDSEDDLGGWVAGHNKTVSPYFEIEEHALAWLEEYTPDPGNHFIVRREVLREHVEQRWWPS